MKRYANAALFIFCILQTARADTVQRDLELILQDHVLAIDNETEEDPFNINNVSELKTFFTGLIRVYQISISSQDGSVCNFFPSCSRFTMKAIQRQGLLSGGLLGADRLMRCHRFSKTYYPISYDIYRGRGLVKLYDPVEKYIR